MSGGQSLCCLATARRGSGPGRGAEKVLAVLWMAIAGAVCHPAPVYGQSGGASVAVGGGLKMDVDTRWPDGAGYRPVRITLTPTVPPVADRTIVVDFTTSGYGRAPGGIHVTQQIELPAGTGSVTATLAVPYSTEHRIYEYQAGEDGRAVKGLQGKGTFQDSAGMESCPRLLAVGDRKTIPQNLSQMFAGQYPTATGTSYAITARDLPSRWIDYSALDLISISLGDLQRVAKNRPQTFRALLEWTAAGGNLLVFDIGTGWERRESLEQLVGLPPADPSRQDSTWQVPDNRQFGMRVGGIGNDAVNPYWDATQDTREYPPANPNSPSSVLDAIEGNLPSRQGARPPASPPFTSRAYEMGMVVAIATSRPFNEAPTFWAWLCNHLTSRRVIWYQRHGVSLNRNNPEFFQFMVQGVGKAPLNAFRVLITLLVLVIGPVNYYLLRRLRRLYLLMVTVPLCAAAVTFALFAYAVFSDGLGTRVRARSVTQINQATGQTECWARLSYYSGMAPGGGLAFSDNVAVYPILGLLDDQPRSGRFLAWQDGQKMKSGWLRSRTPTQFLTVRSRKSQLGVDVGAPAGGKLPLANRLGTHVEQIVVRDEQGGLYWTAGLPDGGRTEAEPIDPAVASNKLLTAINGCQLAFPPGVDASVVSSQFGRRYYYSSGYYGDAPAPAATTSLLESSIQGIARISSSPLGKLGPRSYAAVVRFSPEVELGTPAARPESSLHLVIGTW